MNNRIGFMQGRLSPIVEGKIQAFPRNHWREEFAIAQQIGLSLMEWTIDHSGFYDNPLVRGDGRAEIRFFEDSHKVRIESVTADNMMQAPFWKAESALRVQLLEDLSLLIESCGSLAVKFVVVPLVDNGSIIAKEEEDNLLDGFMNVHSLIVSSRVHVLFESDYEPRRLASFIDSFPERHFGINFDMGNSAALGWSPDTEVPALGQRILNVHLKDRVRGGGTVPFGLGNVNFEAAFRLLKTLGYGGNYIIQGARASDGDHVGVLLSYASRVERLIDE